LLTDRDSQHDRWMPPWSFSSDDILKLGLAIAIGGAVGAEREYRDKAAGFRTMIFICVGATLFTMFSQSIGILRDQARIAAQVVTGVGFLGGGVILREGGSIMGLTTAAAIWLTAALGMAVGAGYFAFALVASAAVLAVLWFFPLIERWIDDLQVTRTYRVIVPSEVGSAHVDAVVAECELRTYGVRHAKRKDDLVLCFTATGPPDAHTRLVTVLLADPALSEVSY
jgi:putative Mg2+ transporter-C (MgtC) family protein